MYSVVSDTSNGYLIGSDTATGKYYYSGSEPGQVTIPATITDDKGAEASAEVTINIFDTAVFKIGDTEGDFIVTKHRFSFSLCEIAQL